MRDDATRLNSETQDVACEACGLLRETLRVCLGALSECYAEELSRKRRRTLTVSELVQGGIVLRAERALRTECTCGRQPTSNVA
jgi:hypothetical protein